MDKEILDEKNLVNNEVNNVSQNVYFEKHCYGVILLDILGQKELMKKIETNNYSSENEAQLQKVLNHLLNLLHQLSELKEAYSPKNAEQIYDQYKIILNNQSLMEELTPERIKASLEEASFGVQQFSDTTLLYAQLDGKDPYMARSLFSLLTGSLSEIMRNAFSNGIFFRGAICVGDGWEIEKGNLLYGPVLHQAYMFEENVARWPRIVLSPSAVEFFKKEYYGLSSCLPKDNLCRRYARCIFYYGIDRIPQLDLCPRELYEFLCFANQTQQLDLLFNTLQEIKNRINETLQLLNEKIKKETSNKQEISKLIMYYRVLKRDLLTNMYDFEMVRHVYSNPSNNKKFEFSKYLQDERETDIGFLTTPEYVLQVD